jgi:tRNA threonylcarbamoyl adenosine modification protein YeaZ
VNAILAIDTSSPDFAVALAVDDRITSTVVPNSSRSHSQLLLATIDEILHGDRAQLTGLVVARGPGSYAGLRVGIATAEGLALALGLPIHGIATLEAVASAAGLREGIAIHPAGRGQYGCQAFRDGAPDGPLFTATADQLTGKVLAGEGAGVLGGTEVPAGTRCRAALLLARPLFASGQTGSIEAVYLREPNITVPRQRTAQPTK